MKKIIAFGLGVFFTFTFSAFASSYFVGEVKGTGFNSDDASAFRELVKEDVPRHDGDTVVQKSSDAQFTLHPKIIRLGNSFLVSLYKTDASGKRRYSSQLKILSIDELDTAATRLVRSVLNETAIKDDAKMGDVTQNEANGPLQKKETSKYWLVGFGPAGIFGVNGQGVSYSFSLGYEWDINTQAAVKIFYAGAFNPNDPSFSSIGLGGAYFFSDRDTSPLIWADFGFGGARRKAGGDVSGFELGVGPALRLFRTSKINVEIQARYAIVLRKFDDGSTPSMLGLQALILF